MRFYPKEYLYTAGQDAALDEAFASGAVYGKVKLARGVIFWKSMLRWYVMPFARVLRVYRRIDHVYGKLCAGGKDYDVDMLMLVLDDGTPLELHIGDDMRPKAISLYEAIQAANPQLQYGKP